MRMFLVLSVAVFSLAGCSRSEQKNAAINVKCHPQMTPFDGNVSTVSTLSDGPGLQFNGFRLGDSVSLIEQNLRSKYPSFAVERARCDNGTLLINAVNTTSKDRPTLCSTHGQVECELISPALSGSASGTNPHLSHFTYARNFGIVGRKTKDVLSELESTYGKSFWSYTIERSKGWPDIKQETWLLWTDISNARAEQFKDEHIPNAVVDALGPGRYVQIQLIHNADLNTTYAMYLSMYVRLK